MQRFKNALLPHDYEWTRFSCGYNAKKNEEKNLKKFNVKKQSVSIDYNMQKRKSFEFLLM